MADATPTIRVDGFAPAEVAGRAEAAGVAKGNLAAGPMFWLAVLAGAFIGLGAIFMTTVTTGAGALLPFGLTKLVGGLVFCVGLILVVVAGAELFTGNNLIIIAYMTGKVTLSKLLRNWGIVYLGNLVGSVVLALLMFFTKQYTFAGGELGKNVLSIANAKTGLAFGQAVALGIMCNFLVCLAVWLCFSGRTTTDKILAILFPITAFVAAGFEHSVANMYFIPAGLFIQWFDPAFVQQAGVAVTNLTVGNFILANLLPVTIGNIIGGAGFVGLLYWNIYLRPKQAAQAAKPATAKK